MIQAIRAGLVLRVKRLKRAPLWRLKTVRRFARGEDGMAAVEFGIIAVPFFALMFAIIETAMIFFASQTLETAVADSARLIMTGQAQSQSFSQSDFKNAVCAKIYALFDCANGMQIDVQTYTSFSSISTAKPIDANGNLQTSNFGYSPGASCNIVVVRLMYQWPVYVSLLSLDKMADLSNNRKLLMATAAFRNEPFGTTSCG
jgi:Flp pilus assembly protein TadG